MKLKSLHRWIIIFDMVQYFCSIVIVPNEPRTYTIALELFFSLKVPPLFAYLKNYQLTKIN